MKINQQTKSTFFSLVKTAVKQVEKAADEEIITDFYIQGNAETGEVVISDDNDVNLASSTVPEAESLDVDEFNSFLAEHFKAVLHEMNQQKTFDHLNIFRPFSFVLVDNNRESIEDLLVVDNDSIMIHESLMQGLDEELDAFLKNLLED